MIRCTSFLYFIFSIASIAEAAPPDWVRQETLVRQGQVLTVVCDGSGPSLDIARKSATDNCRSTAADQANGSVNIQSMTIETEKTANFHQEISSNKQVTNLICYPEKEYSEEVDSHYKVWIRCRYDLGKAKIEVVDTKKDQAAANVQVNALGSGLVVNRENVSSKISNGNLEIQHKKYIQGENRQLILTTIPQCENLLIRGEAPRSMKCSENPQIVFIYPSDAEILIRGPNGFAPKHIQLRGKKETSAKTETETLEIYLEKM